jgi:phospholipase/lecithinase/hemolysin
MEETQSSKSPPHGPFTSSRSATSDVKVTPFTCQEPDEFLFWDGIHPTKAVHGIIAQEAASVLSR